MTPDSADPMERLEPKIELVSVPGWWDITLISGAVMHLSADSFSGLDDDNDDYVFSSLYSADQGLHPQLSIEGKTPRGDQRRVLVTVARIPKIEVATIISADPPA